jgi:hypothetical protein
VITDETIVAAGADAAVLHARCSAGKVILGGGLIAARNREQVIMNSSGLTYDNGIWGWAVIVSNRSSSRVTMTVRAICAHIS